MASQPQRKPSQEASPPPRRTAIPPAANDNRAYVRALILAGGAVLVALLAYLAFAALAG